ncbi:uncharacterized protein (DUF1800 family) [Chitinivorax tropicus]|uniref:Uncharacterized protein (DUF1800 family) n=1 Tax=Chitinivorax tropicus TaxID=714531 RepID=A0A840MIF6_9PROT|nr:DUF1800 domain-containing protein [Chitinivorax tropicus]MBB5018994.1 uncharacterized protein (DUF1800 family) [Chitinivorax tropicus]
MKQKKHHWTHMLSVCLLATMPLLLPGCGGGGGSNGSTGATTPPPTSTPSPVSQTEASRFLAQASFGPQPGDIERLAPQGYTSWLDQQFAMSASNAHQLYVDQQIAAGNKATSSMVHESFWKQAAAGQDQLRQRVAFALSELFVVSVDGAPAEYPRGVAAYLDLLGKHAFGNYRELLEAVSLNPMMGLYLSHLRNRKEDATSGRVPDENYAREIMQLFSIGLYELNPDGTVKLANGKPIETYSNEDVTGLAKVFTGWSWGGPDQSDKRFFGGDIDPNRDILPMQNYPKFHSTTEKRFLGLTIPAGTTGKDSLKLALDHLFNHPNTGPFISRQLIQRLVTSNPSPAYVQRVAAVFANNGQGVRGDMKAVIQAILLDHDARDLKLMDTSTGGKLREPVVRLANWMRAFGKPSASGRYLIGNTDSPTSSLGQTPLRSPSVFNFFRPGYVPAGTTIADQNMVAPEFQIAHETSVVGYYNLMQDVVARGVGTSTNGVRDIAPDYATELSLADNADALVSRVELMLSYGSLDAGNRQLIRDAIAAISIPADANKAATARRNRVQTAIYLVMVSSDYLIQR